MMKKSEEIQLLNDMQYRAIRLAESFNDPEIEEKANDLIKAIKERKSELEEDA